jgi:flagellar M-ring protein FliF
MRPEDVTVVGSEGQVLSAPGRVGGAGGATARTKAEAAFEDELAASITAMLARVTGPNHVAVTVSADLDLSQRQSTSEDFETDTAGTEPPQVLAEQVTTEVYGEGAAQGGETGVLGPDGAVIAPTVSAPDTPAGAYERTDADRTYALDRVVEQVTEAPGRIERLNVAVLLDDATVSADQAESIQTMVAAAAGIDTARGDSLVVTSMPFETSTADELLAAQEEAAAAQRSSEQMALYRTLGIVALGLIALIFAFLSTRRARRVHLTPIDIGEITASSTERIPASVAIPAPAPIAIPQPADRTAAAMAQVAEMAERRPEDVAGILRTWLAESKDGR